MEDLKLMGIRLRKLGWVVMDELLDCGIELHKSSQCSRIIRCEMLGVCSRYHCDYGVFATILVRRCMQSFS
jgi:hypothetical protein